MTTEKSLTLRNGLSKLSSVVWWRREAIVYLTLSKMGVNIWFAVDNIDLLEDPPTWQNAFHGTVIVINQRNVDGEPVNQPLVIP